MGYTTILMFVVMLGLIFIMQRQQKKAAAERQNQLNSVQKGDEVVTIGGLYALVDEVDTEAKKVVLDVDGVFLTFELAAIKRIVTKTGVGETTPAVEPADQQTTPVADDNLPVAEETAVEAIQPEETAISEK
ncbi:preprotein translocase subunit YajC [Streptococcus halichoeri]|uniref:preprotein translocase subunit YajC n=1 Tax=Streptococcus halichoeri TaxID=254785 RepID=UPI00135B33E2|nr:preprotein translocase subunit YajC [Streptococcus halichoeri]